MSWTVPITFVDNTVLTSSQMNTYLRDNMLETMPARATTAGSVFVTQSRNQIAERIPTDGYVDTTENIIDSDDYVDVGKGPSVSVQTGTSALIFLSCSTNHTTSGSQMGYSVSGATEIEASNQQAVMIQSTINNVACGVIFQSGLNPGLNTFTAKYGMTKSGTATFLLRRLAVFPF